MNLLNTLFHYLNIIILLLTILIFITIIFIYYQNNINKTNYHINYYIKGVSYYLHNYYIIHNYFIIS